MGFRKDCLAGLLSWIIFCVLVQQIFGECLTFGDQVKKKRYSYNCSKECLNSGEISGSTVYSSNSSICSAAVHAGVAADNEEIKVKFRNVKLFSNFVGTVRNRRVSKSLQITTEDVGYQFNNSKWIPEHLKKDSWMTDVYLIHSSYYTYFLSKDDFWAACLWDSPNFRGNTRMMNWEFKELKATRKEGNITRSELTSKYRDNFRAFNCFGTTSYNDVFGVAVRQEDSYVADKLTYIVPPNGNLTIQFTKQQNYNTIFTKRFPDEPKVNGTDLPLVYKNLSETDDGLYCAGNKNENKKCAYYQIKVKECPDEKYGRKCGKKCTHCSEHGVCHSLIGACVCRPGFKGKICDERCPLDHFGSKCQFKCGRKDLGNGIIEGKENCFGLTFCSPSPMGCSCSFGYEGLRCDQYTNLTFPYFANAPTVKLRTFSEVEIQFNEWNKIDDHGDTFGYEIASYRVELHFPSIRSPISEVIQPNKSMSYKAKLELNKVYEVRIYIKLELSKTGRTQQQKFSFRKFSLPCFVNETDRNLQLSKRETNSLQFRVNVPSIQSGFKGCYFVLKENPKYSIVSKNFDCVNNSIEMNASSCTFVNLRSGQEYSVEVWCENEILRCDPSIFSAITSPNISEYVSYSDYELRISKFFLYDQYETNLTIFELKTNSSNKNLQNINIAKYSLKILATKSDLIWDGDEKTYFINLTGLFSTSEPVDFSVVLEGKFSTDSYSFRSAKQFVSTSSSPIPISMQKVLISVLVVVVFVLFLLIAIMMFYYRKRKEMPNYSAFKRFRGKKDTKDSNHQISPQSIPPEKAKTERIYDNNLNKNTDDDVSKSYCNKNIVISGKENDVPLVAYSPTNENESVEGYLNIDQSTFEQEQEIILNGFINAPTTPELFQSVPKDCGKSCSISSHPMNKLKNRYKNNMPYDETRVVLSVVNNDPFSDYINANVMKGVNENKWYIASQGPKDNNKNTIGDFWRMVIETDVKIIVMVANFYEHGKKKVGDYFKPNESLLVDGFAVDVVERIQKPHFIRSIIQVSYGPSDSDVRRVIHFQFIKWPDHGVPTQIFPLVFMVQNILNEYENGGIVIHCSAGIGRTGTILLVFLLKEIHDTFSWIDPIFTLHRMREARARLVENMPQFNLGLLLLYECIYGKIGSISTNDINQRWHHYLKEASALFDRLLKQPVLQTYTFGENHIRFNRNPSVLPSDNHVVHFWNEEFENNSDYLNAISIDIEDIHNSIIVTEHPTQSTMYNFWKMILFKKCSHLFMLNFEEESAEFPSVLPLQDGFADYGDFALNVTKPDTSLNFPAIQYMVHISTQETAHLVNVIQILDWTREEEHPKDISNIEKIACIIKEIANSSAPIVLCCCDGVTASGFVSCAVNVINRLDLYQELNVYNSVLRIRRFRPEFLQSRNQFLKIYEVAKMYLENNATYQNFQ